MQYVNYDAIVKNAKFFKSLLGKSKLCAVIKSDAYGHNLLRVASCLHGVADMFAVGSLDEANRVEMFGEEVLILLPLDARQTRQAVQRGHLLTLDSFDTLQLIVSGCSQEVARVHIKIDSGMSRLGFRMEDLPLLLRKLQGKNVRVEGIFTHFYGQSKKSCDEQLNYFEKCSKIVCREYRGILRHVANTSAVLLDKRYHLDMARIGLGLYGYGSNLLTQSKTVVAKVLAVKTVRRGDVVGYGATHKFDFDGRVAVVNIGYADGLGRNHDGKMVKISNSFCKIVGHICMSMMIVDVTNATVKVGDEVILLGDGVNIATENNIIYQLLCNLH